MKLIWLRAILTDTVQGRSVVSVLGTHTKVWWNVRRRRESLGEEEGGLVARSLINFLFLGPLKWHFLCFPGGRFINRSRKKANYSNRNINKIIYIYNFFFQIFEVRPCCGHQVQSDWLLIGGIFTLNLDKTVNWCANAQWNKSKLPGYTLIPKCQYVVHSRPLCQKQQLYNSMWNIWTFVAKWPFSSFANLIHFYIFDAWLK